MRAVPRWDGYLASVSERTPPLIVDDVVRSVGWADSSKNAEFLLRCMQPGYSTRVRRASIVSTAFFLVRSMRSVIESRRKALQVRDFKLFHECVCFLFCICRFYA